MIDARHASLAANVAAWPAALPRPRETLAPHVRLELDGRDGAWPLLAVRDGDAWTAVHGRRDPIREAAQQLADVDVAGSSTLFVVGLGLGYVLEALDAQAWTGRVVAFEPDGAVITAFLARRDWSHWLTSGRLTVLCGPAYDGLDGVVPSLTPNREEPVVVVHPVIGRVFRAGAEEAVRLAARAWFGARANQEARRANGGRYLLNTLRNLPVLAREPDAAVLAGAFAGVPALLVAAGPSLDRTIGRIGPYRDRVVLIAVDTALRPLLSAGIAPDVVVGVDPTEANARHLAELPSCADTFLLGEGSLDPEALPHFAGRSFFFHVTGHHPWPWLDAVGLGRSRLRAWGSVLTTAFDAALTLGCTPIVFTGADLAFTDGRPYARGTTYEEEWQRERAWGASLEDSWAQRVEAWPETIEPGVGGVRVRTAPHLRAFRDWIAAQAAKADGRTIVNATGGGILVGAGIAERPLDAALGALSPLTTPPGRVIREAYRRGIGPRAGASAPCPPAAVQGAWIEETGVSRDALADALGLATRGRAAAGAGGHDAPAPPEAPGPRAGLSAADRAHLDALEQTSSLRLVRLAEATQDLLAELRRELRSLGPTDAVVVVDALGRSAGAQVRRALDAVLCERDDLWLDYRRFADPSSRLAVVRTRPEGAALAPEEADADKWHPSHQEAADTLVPLVLEHLTQRGQGAPSSVVDVGCGAGYWLAAFARHGAAVAHGVTPRGAETAPPAGVVRAPLAAIPDLGRRFDLCLCLEVVQRLAPAAQDALIARCTQLSDTVLFSSRAPGAPDGGPHDRPLPYWAAKFWRHGFTLDDGLRCLVEQRWDLPRTVFDCAVVFRRTVSAADVAAGVCARQARAAEVVGEAARAYDRFMHGIWWTIEARRAGAAADAPAEFPHPALVPWTIPRARLVASGHAHRVFRFRSDAARWYVTHPAAALVLLEDDVPMAETADALAASSRGAWSRWRDELTINTGDGSDPRTSGRRYVLLLPAHVAAAESRPPAIDASAPGAGGGPA